MSLRSLLSQSVTVVAPGSTTDEYGNVVSSWAAGVSTTYRGLVQQTQSTEVTVGRDTIVTDWLLFLPPEAVVNQHDRITQGSRTFEVVGNPDVVNTPRGVHHIEARLVDSAG